MENQNEQYIIDPKRPIVRGDEGNLLANLDIPARKPSIMYIGSLLLITMIAGAFCFSNNGRDNRAGFIPMTLCLLAILTGFILHKRIGAAPRNWLTPDMFIVPVFCIFHFFYIVYYAFGLVPQDPEIFMFSDKVLPATFLCLCCLSGFLMGYEISGGLFNQANFPPSLIPAPAVSMFLGKLLITFAIVFYWGMVFKVGIGRVMSDYEALTSVGYLAGGRLFWVSLDFAMVGIAVYCATSGLLYNKCMKGKIFLFATCGFILGVLMMGDRGAFIRLAPVPIMAFHYFQRKIKLKWAAIAVLAVIFISGVLSLTRTVTLLDVKKITAEYKHQQQGSRYNIFEKTGLEFGSTIKIVVAAMAIVPSEHPYRYGKSYIDSILIAVPNIIPGRIRTSESTKDIVLWVNEMAYGTFLKWGRGGSIVMEAYLNFGFIGTVIFFSFLGCGYRCIYERFLFKPNLVRTVLLLTATGGMMLWIRNALAIAIRPPVWGLMFAIMVQLLFGSKTNQADEAGEMPYKGDL